MKPQADSLAVVWAWHHSPTVLLACGNHTGRCVRGVVHICHPGTTVGASHRLCHFPICHRDSKALTGLFSAHSLGITQAISAASVTMAHN